MTSCAWFELVQVVKNILFQIKIPYPVCIIRALLKKSIFIHAELKIIVMLICKTVSWNYFPPTGCHAS